MELTVLVENTTCIDHYLLGEPALSFWLRDGDRCLLFDCGYSEILVRNADQLGLDLAHVDTVVLSHGHLDHTWGLAPLLAARTGRGFEGRPWRRARLIAHPEALTPRHVDGAPIGTLLSQGVLAEHFDLTLSRAPVALTDRLLFLGEIPRVTPFEATSPIGLRETSDGPVPDLVPDDTALAYHSPHGLVIITGCSHAGIVNIVRHAWKLTGETRVAGIIGGLHLLGPEPAGLAETVAFLRDAGVGILYPCHCTSLAARIALSAAAPVGEVGVGQTFALDDITLFARHNQIA